ncbi:hypothetical protein HU200_046657 [Digitaria exilis]|uniref:Uncharacterized protein n=1 Tax=Digitaria exilis TaxID=1010633 RepID=A0A835AWF7_9POAL|nr:hypothetical protein HU200_046657 [Digitaria exilis]
MQLSPAARKIRGDRADVVLEPHLVGEVPGPGYDPKRVRIFVDTSSPSSRRPSSASRCPISQSIIDMMSHTLILIYMHVFSLLLFLACPE